MAAKAPAILIVDDNAEFADLLGTLIAEQGLTPILAHTASNALVLSKLYAPAAIIVDLLLPDMTGHKLIKELSKPGAPPICVITGVFKGQTQMEKVRASGKISGWYEKPFDTRVLVEQIVNLVGKPVVGRVEHKKVGEVTADFDINILDPVEVEGIRDAERSGKPRSSPFQAPLGSAVTPAPSQGDSELDIDIDVDEELDGDAEALALWDVVEHATPSRPMLPVPEEALTPIVSPAPGISIELDEALRAATEAALRSVEQSASQLAPDQTPSVPISWPEPVVQETVTGMLGPDPFATGSLGTSVTNPFQDKLKSDFGREHSPIAAQVKSGLRSKMRSGNLKPATVARLLTAFYISQETGEIAFERGGERKVIYLSEGRPVYARSNQDADRLGAIARKAFGLKTEQINLALQIARETDRMIGDVLIEQGMLEETKRLDLVREQTRSIIRNLLTWSEGRYVIGFNVRAEIQRAQLHEHPASLVIGAIRDQFEVDRLRKLVPDKMLPMPAPSPPYELHELPVGDAEALLLLRATGARSVGALLADIAPRLDEQGVRAVLYAMLVLGMLVAGRGAQPGAKPAAPSAPA